MAADCRVQSFDWKLFKKDFYCILKCFTLTDESNYCNKLKENKKNSNHSKKIEKKTITNIDTFYEKTTSRIKVKKNY